MRSKKINTLTYLIIPYSASEKSLKDSFGIRKEIVTYALQFEGNPYVWGGTSLTSGTDCSGFTQSVFRNKGIDIPRTSKLQAAGGKNIPLSDIKPADLLFYKKNGIVNHVALYIGDRKVISAGSPSTGIRVLDYNYRKPCKAVSYLG